MEPVAHDEVRENRIHDEIIVDAYGPEEQAMGWYYYLADTIRFPFKAKCTTERISSPLRIGQQAVVRKMAPESACEHEMMVLIQWNSDALAVPLSQLTGLSADEETQQAIAD